METTRTEEQADKIISEIIAQGGDNPRFPGMSYEDGVRAALEWAFGQTDEHPYPKQ